MVEDRHNRVEWTPCTATAHRGSRQHGEPAKGPRRGLAGCSAPGPAALELARLTTLAVLATVMLLSANPALRAEPAPTAPPSSAPPTTAPPSTAADAAAPPAAATDGADAQAAKPTLVTWKVTQLVRNRSSYRLRLLSRFKTEQTIWDMEPTNEILPGKDDRSSISNSFHGHGLVVLLTYGAYDMKTDAFVGMVVAKSGVDCTQPTKIACLNDHRWEGVACDSRGMAKGRWTDNGASPTDFWTDLQIGDKQVDCERPPSQQEAAPQKSLEEPKPRQEGNGIPWRITGQVTNNSPFVLKLRNIWNSEGTHFDTIGGIFPPREIKPGISLPLAWSYVNAVDFHGPAALIMYDAYDGNTYVGSVVTEAAADCNNVTHKGCSLPAMWANAVADAVPTYFLQSHGKLGPLPNPIALYVDYEIRGGRRSAAQPPADLAKEGGTPAP